jgi:hypothetical protein
MRRLVIRRSVARVHSVICGWQVNSPGRLRSGDDAMGVAADQLDQLIGAALTVRFEPLIPAGRLILRRVSRRDLLPGLLCAADDYELWRTQVSQLSECLSLAALSPEDRDRVALDLAQQVADFW